MDIRSADIEKIVRQVLESMGTETKSAPKAAGVIPATGRVAMLT